MIWLTARHTGETQWEELTCAGPKILLCFILELYAFVLDPGSQALAPIYRRSCFKSVIDFCLINFISVLESLLNHVGISTWTNKYWTIRIKFLAPRNIACCLTGFKPDVRSQTYDYKSDYKYPLGQATTYSSCFLFTLTSGLFDQLLKIFCVCWIFIDLSH